MLIFFCFITSYSFDRESRTATGVKFLFFHWVTHDKIFDESMSINKHIPHENSILIKTTAQKFDLVKGNV